MATVFIANSHINFSFSKQMD